MPAPKDKTLPPIRPSAAVTAKFRCRLLRLLDEMHDSVTYWIEARYKSDPPAIAQDEVAANVLQREMKKLARRWLKRFETGSQELANYYATAIQRRTDERLKKILKDAGFTVKFRATRAQRDVMAATVHESVALIQSIPARYLTNVEGLVMRSVQTGRDLGKLSKDLKKTYGVTKRRAALISRDQNNKATSAMNRARQIELGITEAIWVHSSAGKTPRPTHVKAGRDKVRYDVSQGWFDPEVQEWILPGQLINCRCTSRSVIPGAI